MSACVLDASALLALLLDEPGAERVRHGLAQSLISTVNLAEVAGWYAREGVTAQESQRLLGPLPVERIAFDTELALAAAALLPATRPLGLSLGDRACLALAGRTGLPVLTADRAWSRLPKGLGLKVDLIR